MITIDEMLDREGIRTCLARYNTFGDRRLLEEFLAMFTADAVLESNGNSKRGCLRFDGREAIRRWFVEFWGGQSNIAETSGAPNFVRHHLSTSLIEMKSPVTASARTYFHVFTKAGPDHAGYYLDDLRKINGDWLIAHRQIRVDWMSSASVYSRTSE